LPKTQEKIYGVVKTIARPIQEFLKLQAASGILLFSCAAVALIWSNSMWSYEYERFWHTDITIGFGSALISKSLLHWINDGFMVIFFFVVGLEIKREMFIGELSSLKKAMLPVVAAIGGMIVPALIYIVFTRGTDMASGWGIPMATDIAFSLGVLTLLGKRIPIQLKIFLTAFAIVDDIGAVIVIALFYASNIIWSNLALAGGIFLMLAGANWLGVRNSLVYAVLGVFLWLAFLNSGVHATVAGVLLAIIIPARSNLGKRGFMEMSQSLLKELERSDGEPADNEVDRNDHARIRALSQACEDIEAPTQRFEHALHPWVIFVIMPIFALANAGVVFSESPATLVSNPLAIGIVLGLIIGKQVGISLFSWGAVRAGLASLPSSVTWRQIYGVGWLGGIGFTMSLFIAGLAFGSSHLMDISKIGIYVGSLVAGLGGALVLWRAAPVIHRKKTQR
jgi:NhaA family Na+:H+ antiporter